jgi:hypothetical protein
MTVREYNDADLDALLAMHRAQGFDYPFPDLRDPIFVSKLVLCEDAPADSADESRREGNCGGAKGQKIVMAALARLTCEMYLLADPHAGTPRQRYARLLELHRAGAADLRARGLDDAHAWLPPRIAKRFGRRLENLGWLRDNDWTPYCFPLR